MQRTFHPPQNQIRNINQRGVSQWGNEQNRLNQQFAQFENEVDWENNNRGNLGSNPQNRGLAIAGGIDRASSQSPLVLPQALQFNNLQANIPFDESKIGAATTDPRIQRTSQLFNDEEEMRRIAEAARERQNREELDIKESGVPKALWEFFRNFNQAAKQRNREKLLSEGATMREVPSMSKEFQQFPVGNSLGNYGGIDFRKLNYFYVPGNKIIKRFNKFSTPEEKEQLYDLVKTSDLLNQSP
jgi:hypothetical protein